VPFVRHVLRDYKTHYKTHCKTHRDGRRSHAALASAVPNESASSEVVGLDAFRGRKHGWAGGVRSDPRVSFSEPDDLRGRHYRQVQW
jgi:hypothetical protein